MQHEDLDRIEVTPKMLRRTPTQHRREGIIVMILLVAFGVYLISSVHPMTAVVGIGMVAAGIWYGRHELRIAKAVEQYRERKLQEQQHT